MRGLVGRLNRLEESKLRSEGKWAKDGMPRKISDGKSMGLERNPNLFELAVRRGPWMHLYPLTDIPERTWRKEFIDMYLPSLLTSIRLNMVCDSSLKTVYTCKVSLD